MTQSRQQPERSSPGDWQDTLLGLQRVLLPLNARAVPFTASIVDGAFDQLDGQSAELLMQRCGNGFTVAESAARSGLTAAQAEQLEHQALQLVAADANHFSLAMQKLFDEASTAGVLVFSLLEGIPRHFPEEFTEIRWACAFGLHSQLAPAGLALLRLPAGTWVAYDVAFVQRGDRVLRTHLQAHPKFLPLEDAATLLQLEAYDLAHCWPLFDGLYLTRKGLVGSSYWTDPECLVALTHALAAGGFGEWRPGELAAALDRVFPDTFQITSGMAVEAMLIWAGMAVFDVSHNVGYWRFRTAGEADGNTNRPGAAAPESSQPAPAQNTSTTEWVKILRLIEELDETSWIPLLAGLKRSAVPAPLLNDILHDLMFEGRTIGSSALAIWRRDEATLALNASTEDLQADSQLVSVNPDSDPSAIARSIIDFLGG